MLRLFLYYISYKSIKIRILNIKISPLSLFDENSVIDSRVLINRFSIIRKTKIDKYTYIGPKCSFNNVEIGSYCSISKNINIGFSTHPIEFISTSPIFFSPKNGTGYKWVNLKTFNDSPNKTYIGNDVWIGANSSIMSGVTIGDGAIIAAHAVVTKDVEPYSIVGGVPAKIIRKRFDDETIMVLLKTKWWQLKDELIRRNVELFNKKITDDSINRLIKLQNENKK